ncbi:hypothetical protein ACFC6L_21320 [Kitasatospora phosalacinea]|uniref:hypothetical protein n=1 Tax=Kitasatospora phosalacinea TaxID=2065 RepID=UPI0035E36E9A
MEQEIREHLRDPVYIYAVAHALGEREPISGLTDPVVVDHLDLLHENGFQHYLASSRNVHELAGESATRTLSSVDATQIGAVVYATNSPSENVTHSQDGWAFLRAASLRGVPLTVVGGNGCGNLAIALRTARNAVQAEGLSSALVVTTDRVTSGSRFEDSGSIILSDGAASCVVGPTLRGPGFRLLGVSTAVKAELGGSASLMAMARVIRTGIHRAVENLRRTVPGGAGPFRLLVTGNYGLTTRRMFSTLCGFDLSETYAPLVADIGHCFSADLLISLAELEKESLLRHGDRLLLLATSPQSWSLIAVEYVVADRPDGRTPDESPLVIT